MSAAQALGVFGGSFDPIHFGHLRAALELALTFGLDRVQLVPNGSPPHRDKAFVQAEHRLAMLELAVSQTPKLSLDDREVHRDGPSYTYDTLAALRAEVGPQVPIIFGVGADAFAQISGWHRADELLAQAHIAVLSRPGSEIQMNPPAAQRGMQPFAQNWTSKAQELVQQPSGLMFRLEMTPLAISSTRIREQIASGWSPRFLLPETVCQYIEQHALYQASTPSTPNKPQ